MTARCSTSARPASGLSVALAFGGCFRLIPNPGSVVAMAQACLRAPIGVAAMTIPARKVGSINA